MYISNEYKSLLVCNFFAKNNIICLPEILASLTITV